MGKAVISKETAEELSSKMLTSITIQNGIHLSDRRRTPGIGFYKDADQYFDPQSNNIHLGIYGPLEIFKVTTEEDYVAALQFFFGHENQHVRSTASTPYSNGVRRSAFAIIEYIAAKEGIRKNFRNEKDYDVFVQTDLPAKGIHIRMRTLMEICGGLMNSVEDGRIERIRSLELPGFERQRRYFRAMGWDQDHPMKPYKQGLTDADRLGLYLNNILSLATTGLYEKGFVAAYGDTEIVDELQKFMPYIAKGVLAKRTRDMADNVVEIAKMLAPLIYSVCKYDKSAEQDMLEKMLADMLSRMINQMDPSKMADTSEREEEVDEGMPLSVFPQSDLVITLDDDVYDKLMEKMKNKKGQGSGLMVKRKHPKEEEKKGDESDGSGSGSDSDKKEQDKEKSGSGGTRKDQKDKDKTSDGKSSGNSKEKGSEDSKGSEGNEGSDGQSKDGSSGKQSGSKSSSSSSESNADSSKSDAPYDKEYSHSEGGASDSKNSNGSHSSGGGENGSVEMVKQQMEEAAKECRADVSETVQNINAAVEHTAKNNRGNAPIVKDDSKPLTAADVKDICSGFEELRRKYKLDQPLPSLLNARAKAFRKKNERYFKSLSTPNVTYLDSGGIDQSLIYGLAFGETNIFRKIGQDKKFNGCVYVLVDNSGSMSGNKRMEACKAAAVVEEGFKGIIPMKIVAFDTCGKVVHEVIKGWDESQKFNCCWNFAVHGRTGCGNEDNKDILIAQKELLARPEEKKLLIVLSDGAPSSIEGTKKAIEETRKKGINVFGIYFEEGRIGDDAKEFQYMYQKDYVCCELSEVDNELTKLMIKFSRS